MTAHEDDRVDVDDVKIGDWVTATFGHRFNGEPQRYQITGKVFESSLSHEKLVGGRSLRYAESIIPADPIPEPWTDALVVRVAGDLYACRQSIAYSSDSPGHYWVKINNSTPPQFDDDLAELGPVTIVIGADGQVTA